MTVLAAILGLVAGALITSNVVRSRERGRDHERTSRHEDELRRSAREVRIELDRLRAALDVLPLGIVIADQRGEVIVRNRVADRFAGSWQGDVLVNEAAHALLVESTAGRAVERTLDLFGPPKRAVIVRGLPISGGAAGALVIIDDITERVRIDAVRTDFVTNISHELKTPVGALTVLAEALVDADDPDDVRRLSDKVVREADRLSRTIDDLLELSRIELGGDAVRDPVQVRPVLEGAAQRIAPLAERHGIEVRIIEPVPDVDVLGDRRQLMSALGNLVENAVKYSEPGGSVKVSASVHDDAVDLVVTDHGVGIPSSDLDRIFERFYRVDRARSRETGGTGLGLSIVRHVANNHGGTVSVESTEGEGSTFRLSIPSLHRPVSIAIEESTSP